MFTWMYDTTMRLRFKHSKLNYSVVIIAVGLCVLCIPAGIKYLRIPADIPHKEEWTREQSQIWLNYVQPCRYYRFRTTEGRTAVNNWCRKRLDALDIWGGKMELPSSHLEKLLMQRDHRFSKEDIVASLWQWSIPVVGGDYADEVRSPYVILIYAQDINPSVKRNLHIKIGDDGTGSLIEVWDNRVYAE